MNTLISETFMLLTSFLLFFLIKRKMEKVGRLWEGHEYNSENILCRNQSNINKIINYANLTKLIF